MEALPQQAEVLVAAVAGHDDLPVGDVAPRGRAISGKYRASGLPERDWISTASPLTKTIARKPSSLRSYDQPSPSGTSRAERASWGGTGGGAGASPRRH